MNQHDLLPYEEPVTSENFSTADGEKSPPKPFLLNLEHRGLVEGATRILPITLMEIVLPFFSIFAVVFCLSISQRSPVFPTWKSFEISSPLVPIWLMALALVAYTVMIYWANYKLYKNGVLILGTIIESHVNVSKGRSYLSITYCFISPKSRKTIQRMASIQKHLVLEQLPKEGRSVTVFYANDRIFRVL